VRVERMWCGAAKPLGWRRRQCLCAGAVSRAPRRGTPLGTVKRVLVITGRDVTVPPRRLLSVAPARPASPPRSVSAPAAVPATTGLGRPADG